MSLLVFQVVMDMESTNLATLITSGLIAWAILALPELILGIWLAAKGSREKRIEDVSGRLIPLVQKEGRISLQDAARELDVTPVHVADAAEELAKRKLPLVYLDRRANEIVSPKAVSLKESILHLLYAQRRMTFDQIASVTESTDEQIVDTMKELSKAGKFRGVIDENSRVVYTQEAVAQLKKAVTECPNCGGKLEAPILPGEEEACPYCGHMIVNRK
jgi:DNA-binding Lrp family transcriptional regulator